MQHILVKHLQIRRSGNYVGSSNSKHFTGQINVFHPLFTVANNEVNKSVYMANRTYQFC